MKRRRSIVESEIIKQSADDAQLDAGEMNRRNH